MLLTGTDVEEAIASGIVGDPREGSAWHQTPASRFITHLQQLTLAPCSGSPVSSTTRPSIAPQRARRTSTCSRRCPSPTSTATKSVAMSKPYPDFDAIRPYLSGRQPGEFEPAVVGGLGGAGHRHTGGDDEAHLRVCQRTPIGCRHGAAHDGARRRAGGLLRQGSAAENVYHAVRPDVGAIGRDDEVDAATLAAGLETPAPAPLSPSRSRDNSS